MATIEIEIVLGQRDIIKDNKPISEPIVKKYHFREDFSCLDYVMIGLPLIDIKKFEVKDPVTGDKTLFMDQAKMDEQDIRAMRKWQLNFINQMNTDNLNWEKSKEIYAMDQILQDPKMGKLVEQCLKQVNPNVSPISEKKSLMKD